MNKYFLLLLVILSAFIMPVMGAYTTYPHPAIKIMDGKDIDLNGRSIGNGTINLTTGVYNSTYHNTTQQYNTNISAFQYFIPQGYVNSFGNRTWTDAYHPTGLGDQVDLANDSQVINVLGNSHLTSTHNTRADSITTTDTILLPYGLYIDKTDLGGGENLSYILNSGGQEMLDMYHGGRYVTVFGNRTWTDVYHPTAPFYGETQNTYGNPTINITAGNITGTDTAYHIKSPYAMASTIQSGSNIDAATVAINTQDYAPGTRDHIGLQITQSGRANRTITAYTGADAWAQYSVVANNGFNQSGYGYELDLRNTFADAYQVPTGYDDKTKPIWKGFVVYPNAGTTGTGASYNYTTAFSAEHNYDDSYTKGGYYNGMVIDGVINTGIDLYALQGTTPVGINLHYMPIVNSTYLDIHGGNSTTGKVLKVYPTQDTGLADANQTAYITQNGTAFFNTSVIIGNIPASAQFPQSLLVGGNITLGNNDILHSSYIGITANSQFSHTLGAGIEINVTTPPSTSRGVNILTCLAGTGCWASISALPSGNVGIGEVNPLTKFAVNGLTSSTGTAIVADASGNFYLLSSTEKGKNMLGNYTPDYSVLGKIPIKSWTYNTTNLTTNQKTGIGFSAEQLDKAGLSILVNYDDKNKPYSIKQDALIIYQQGQINQLEKRIKALEEKSKKP